MTFSIRSAFLAAKRWSSKCTTSRTFVCGPAPMASSSFLVN